LRLRVVEVKAVSADCRLARDTAGAPRRSEAMLHAAASVGAGRALAGEPTTEDTPRVDDDSVDRVDEAAPNPEWMAPACLGGMPGEAGARGDDSETARRAVAVETATAAAGVAASTIAARPKKRLRSA